MKMKFFYMLPLMVMALLACLPRYGYSYDLPDDLDITEVYFNHNTNSSTNDAITIKENYSTTITAPEWNGANNKKFAYVCSTLANIKATLLRDDAGINSADIYVVCNSGTSIGSFPEYTRFTFTQPSVTYQIDRSSGSVNKYVGIYEVTLRWAVVGINGSSISPVVLGDTTHDYYTIADSPKAPYNGSYQAGPWTAVLDSSCTWASGDSVASEAACKITEGIYYNFGRGGGESVELYYDPQQHVFSYFDPGDEIDMFRLTEFLSQIDSYEDYVDCLDMSNILQTYCSSLGCSIGRWIVSTSDYENGNLNSKFITNQILPIGWYDETIYWAAKEWPCHFVTAINDSVFDACILVNKGVNQFVPCNLSWEDYLDYLIDYPSVIYYDDKFVYSYPEIVNN